MANNWVKVFESINNIEAEIVRAMLLENNIESVMMNKRDSSYLSFGLVEVYCQPNDVITALHLLNEQVN